MRRDARLALPVERKPAHLDAGQVVEDEHVAARCAGPAERGRGRIGADDLQAVAEVGGHPAAHDEVSWMSYVFAGM